ncbi:MAG: tRNA lysidine(34) synthetase TilS [Micrococcales bacterium]
MPERPRLTPEVADTRRVVRDSVADLLHGELVLVACSGGADSMALAAAAGFEQSRKGSAGIRVGGVIVEHGLQEATKQIAAETKAKLEALGLSPVVIETVKVASGSNVEANARAARYAAIQKVATELDAKAVLLGHTLDDQAETVLLGLARGSGARSISGMRTINGIYRRPFLAIRRSQTEKACEAQGIDFWNDPHNQDDSYTRVRVRKNILPILETQLGPGIAEALARTADQAAEDEALLTHQAKGLTDLLLKKSATSVSFQIADLRQPMALRHRMILQAFEIMEAPPVSRIHVLAIDDLIDDWHGQKPLTLPSVRVERIERELVFKLTKTLKPGAC